MIWGSRNSVKMAQDNVSDALNNIMNIKRAGKQSLIIKRKSKLLISLLNMMKEDKHIDFEDSEDGIHVSILKLNKCKSIKPRFYVGVEDIEKYLRRFLPSRKLGKLVISTNKGLIGHEEAEEQNVGGALVAYYY